MADDANPRQITLGGRTYELAPQSIGRISRKLRQVREAFGTVAEDGQITTVVHDALKVFIPDLAPEWELAGYPSAEAYAEKQRHERVVTEAGKAYTDRLRALADKERESGEEAELPPFEEPEADWADPYEEAADRSPTFTELADAVEAVYAINGGKRLERLLGNLVDPQMLKAIARNEYLVWASRRSQRSPLPSGASASTDSGTNGLTSPEVQPTDSPSPSSSSPSTPEPSAAV